MKGPDFNTAPRSTAGACGYRGQNHTRPLNAPGRFPSSLPSRTSSKLQVPSFQFPVSSFLLLLLPIPLLAAESSVATFDVAPGGILAALAAAATSALGTWAAMRNRPPRQRQSTRIEDQPIKVETVAGHPSETLCEAKHDAINGRLKDNVRDHENIFPRIASLESRVSTLEGVIGQINKTNASIDDKLTILLRRK